MRSVPPSLIGPAVGQTQGMNAPVERILVSDQVYERLKTAITSGEYPPGTRLAEQDVAGRLSVSQTPVREALTRLARERLVIQLPRRGSFVAEISTEDARHAYQVRAPLERLAASLVCAADESRAARLVAGLEEDFARFVAAAAADDLPAVVEADASFHRRIWHATGNPMLIEVWAMVEGCIRGFTMVSNRIYYADLPAIAETHRPLLEVIRTRDAQRAADLFEEHALNVWRSIEADS